MTALQNPLVTYEIETLICLSSKNLNYIVGCMTETFEALSKLPEQEAPKVRSRREREREKSESYFIDLSTFN